MKSVKELRKKAAARPRKSTPVYSTSEARANFAEALETAQVESAVVGFDRYGRTVAALVPVEAVYILAGREDMVSPLQREAIIAGARQFIAEVPNRLSARAEKVARPARATKAPVKKKVSAKKPAKAPAKKKSAKSKRNGR
jgi:endonuclease YncB( thermonuclease family)